MQLKGKIVLIPFPFTDLTATKLRPALILYEGEKDVVAAFISSRTEKPKQTDITVEEKHPEFKQTGLKLASVIKLDKVATIIKNPNPRRNRRSRHQNQKRDKPQNCRSVHPLT
jgi:mRNA interferase MazF